MRKVIWILVLLVVFSCNQSGKKPSNGEQILQKKSMEVNTQEGVITKISAKNFEDTYAALVAILTDNPNLKIIAELDHQANAASVGLSLNPSRIVLFGNPKLGTPLMQNAQTTGLDLPQKIMICEDDSQVVRLLYNDPMHLKKRHDIQEKDEILNKIGVVLDKITNGAAGL